MTLPGAKLRRRCRSSLLRIGVVHPGATTPRRGVMVLAMERWRGLLGAGAPHLAMADRANLNRCRFRLHPSCYILAAFVSVMS